MRGGLARSAAESFVVPEFFLPGPSTAIASCHGARKDSSVSGPPRACTHTRYLKLASLLCSHVQVPGGERDSLSHGCFAVTPRPRTVVDVAKKLGKM